MTAGPECAAVAERLAAVRARIALAAARAGRDAAGVRLLGAAKRQPLSRIRAAVRAGLRDIGENYVQEARRVQQELREIEPELPPIRWHGIGALQRNKARDAVACFTCIHSVDRTPLAAALAAAADKAGKRLDVLLEVNLSGEASKAGVPEAGLDDLFKCAVALPALRVVGLMTLPAPSPDPEAVRPVFAKLRALRDTLRERVGGEDLTELSMGMSDDLEVAVEEGATMVRIGTALFGPREPKA